MNDERRTMNGEEKKTTSPPVLVLDVGGTHVKMLATGQTDRREIATGPAYTPEQFVHDVAPTTADWKYDAISIGIPGPVLGGRIVANPPNLGPGWVGFDFEKALGKPVKVINDAALQALGSYEGGKMLFLGLGTGLGSAMVVSSPGGGGIVEPMELGHLPYRKRTFEDYVGERGLERFGKKKWRRLVADVVERFQKALEPDYIVLGGGNARKLKTLPENCRLGDNEHAFEGGFRLWQEQSPVAPGQRHELDKAMTEGKVHEGATK
ncbi:MAG TPA: ROK family protein [Pirellulales bacterium]|jgi:polyphosphate glucokinase|nr:ROK family protein [Pirellulales bacterium]